MNETFKITGAEAILLSLIEENVNTIFGYPGGAIMPIYNKLFDKYDKVIELTSEIIVIENE